jgi:hypothetical protein
MSKAQNIVIHINSQCCQKFQSKVVKSALNGVCFSSTAFWEMCTQKEKMGILHGVEIIIVLHIVLQLDVII